CLWPRCTRLVHCLVHCSGACLVHCLVHCSALVHSTGALPWCSAHRCSGTARCTACALPGCTAWVHCLRCTALVLYSACNSLPVHCSGACPVLCP
ncbi:hypothetical protein CYMTET_36249, partial [Cymbomonas tetramitiformis]